MTARRRSRAGYSFWRATTLTLATSRFRSHSHGLTVVSSKSFRSKTTSCCGVPYSPKLLRWASPASTTGKPVVGVWASIGHERGRAAQETERRGRHAPHAQRQQFALAALVGR